MSTSLRIEALPLEYAALNTAQRQAMATIVGLLQSAVHQLRPGREAAPLSARHFPLDVGRSSRIAMLSGERGTGKTTVLVSIKRACDELRGGPAPPHKREDDGSGPACEMPNKLHRELLSVAQRTVWLEPIDMEPLPASTNLLAAILARVGSVARTARGAPRGAEAPTRGRRGLLEREREREQDPLVELRRLQAVVATSWEDVPSNRRSHLDPHAYAAEVLQAEGDRLSLNEKLGKVLDDLAGLFDLDPLFVLPVDDFDLNPARSLELLRIVRAISVPRLFTLVLGDLRVAELIVRLGFTGTLAELAGKAAAAGPLAEFAEDLRAMPGELASHLVRKLIPPSQVIRLERMTLVEALWYRPPVAVAEAENSAPRLCQLLIQCQLPFEWMPLRGLVTDLWTFLFARATPAPAKPPGTPGGPLLAPVLAPMNREALVQANASGVYAARSIFRAAPRRVADLWLDLEKVVGAASDPTDPEPNAAKRFQVLLTLLAQYVRDRIAEDGHLSAVMRQTLQNAISQDEDGKWLLDYEVMVAEPRVGHTFSVELELRRGGEPEARGGSSKAPDASELTGLAMVVSGRPGEGWALRLDPRGQGGESSPAPRVEETTAAACMLYHDLLDLGPTGFRRKRPLLWQRPELDLPRWTSTEWRVDDSRSVEVIWPAPGLFTFWEFDLFLELWNDSLRRFRNDNVSAEEELEHLLYGWLNAATAVMSWQPVLAAATTTEGLDWTPLVGRLEALDHSPNFGPERQKAARDWLARVACILMPEVIGFRPLLTRPFATEKLGQAWTRAANEIRLVRKGIVETLTQSAMPELAWGFATAVPDGFPVAVILDDVTRERLGRLGPIYTAPPQPGAKDTASAPGFSERFIPVQKAIEANGAALRTTPGVLDVRPGIEYQRGWSTGRLAVVVTVLTKRLDLEPSDPELLPQEVGGFPVDVRPATPQEQLQARSGGAIAALPHGSMEEPLLRPGALMVASGSRPTYIAIEKTRLKESHDSMNVICNVGPDGSWESLNEFLNQTRSRLAVGMYALSARHIVESLKRKLVPGKRRLLLVLDPGTSPAPNDESGLLEGELSANTVRKTLREALGQRLSCVWAAVQRPGRTTGGVFPTSYRMGVAVRDSEALWLSTGSWRPIDQPPSDQPRARATRPRFVPPLPREWHVVVEHERLAAKFEEVVRYDYESAEPFQEPAGDEDAPETWPELLIPVVEPERNRGSRPKPFAELKLGLHSGFARVQPLLSPENYIEHVLPLIRDARETLRFQNPYIVLSPAMDPRFADLVRALFQKVKDGSVDVRVILGDTPNTRDMLEALEAANFDVSRFRVQKGMLVQGIIVDDEAVVIGNHRWSSLGTTQDRAASLLFQEARIAQYFAAVFDHDWSSLARQSVSAEKAMPQVADPAKRTPSGMARVPWRAVFDG